MGVHENIGLDRFPKQGIYLNAEVDVCFNYQSHLSIPGVIVRDDMEEPYRTIIKLADGRFIEAVECQYSLRGAATQGDTE
jgi:hypothetical protein